MIIQMDRRVHRAWAANNPVDGNMLARRAQGTNGEGHGQGRSVRAALPSSTGQGTASLVSHDASAARGGQHGANGSLTAAAYGSASRPVQVGNHSITSAASTSSSAAARGGAASGVQWGAVAAAAAAGRLQQQQQQQQQQGTASVSAAALAGHPRGAMAGMVGMGGAMAGIGGMRAMGGQWDPSMAQVPFLGAGLQQQANGTVMHGGQSGMGGFNVGYGDGYQDGYLGYGAQGTAQHAAENQAIAKRRRIEQQRAEQAQQAREAVIDMVNAGTPKGRGLEALRSSEVVYYGNWKELWDTVTDWSEGNSTGPRGFRVKNVYQTPTGQAQQAAYAAYVAQQAQQAQRAQQAQQASRPAQLKELKEKDPDAYRLMRNGANEADRLRVRTRMTNEYIIPLTTST